MKRFSLYTYIFLGFCSIINFTYPLVELKALENQSAERINTNYLKRIPKSDYILGPGDKLLIIVSRDYPELSVEVDIDGEGTVNLPKLNRVYIDGLTTIELRKILNEAYLDYVKFPDVEILIRKHRPITVLVKGEVNESKLINLQGSFKTSSIVVENMKTNNSASDSTLETYFFPTVFDAIRASGGITDYSDLSKVEISRKETLSNNGGRKRAILNLLKNDGEPTNENIRIYTGDIITVPKSKTKNSNIIYDLMRNSLNPKYLKVFVSGKVEMPGYVNLPKKSTLNNAIEVAGGTKVLPGKIKLVRIKNDATFDNVELKYNRKAIPGTKANPYLNNGDLIFVNKSFVNNSSEAVTQITKPFTGIFSVYGLIKAISD